MEALRLRLFLLAYADELEVSLVFESDEDSNSILCFQRICDDFGIGACINEGFTVASPTRVLVLRPASSAQSLFEELVDVGRAVAIAFDEVSAEVVLEDVVGHAVAIVNNTAINKCDII
jgi:hypothetical protein